MAEIKVTLTEEQCDLIALALDTLISVGNVAPEKLEQLNELFWIFDTISEPDEPIGLPQVKGIHLVYDRDSNVRPLFPK